MQLTTNLQSDQYMDNLCKDVLSHRRAATFLTKAAGIHLEAAKQLLEGDFEEVAERIQRAQDLLLHVCSLHQSAKLHLEATKLRWGGISTATKCEKAQNLLRQASEIQQKTEDIMKGMKNES